ncbi:MAG: aspartate carbamoyltransferase [Candidatus Micrarchaeia archaeon]
MSWKNLDVISMKNFSRKQTGEFLQEAEKMQKAVKQKKQFNTLNGKTVALLIFEPSTRTYLSFDVAVKHLGGQTTAINNPNSSSIVKGETLHDTVKAVETYVDCIVLRHPQEGSAQNAANAASIPVINAGDGTNQHPTQALLDALTIKTEIGKLDKIKILMAGDLKNGRTVHSLAQLLSNYEVEFQFYSPPNLEMPDEILKDINGKKTEKLDFLDVSQADVVYATRIQQERLKDPEEYKKYSYKIDRKKIKEMKKNAILMHPLPRVNEITSEVDEDPRAKYFTQEANGLPARMALLKMILQ